MSRGVDTAYRLVDKMMKLDKYNKWWICQDNNITERERRIEKVRSTTVCLYYIYVYIIYMFVLYIRSFTSNLLEAVVLRVI